MKKKRKLPRKWFHSRICWEFPISLFEDTLVTHCLLNLVFWLYYKDTTNLISNSFNEFRVDLIQVCIYNLRKIISLSELIFLELVTEQKILNWKVAPEISYNFQTGHENNINLKAERTFRVTLCQNLIWIGKSIV